MNLVYPIQVIIKRTSKLNQVICGCILYGVVFFIAAHTKYQHFYCKYTPKVLPIVEPISSLTHLTSIHSTHITPD